MPSSIAFSAQARQMARTMGLIILMRHAKAVRENEAPSDRARGLTQRGRDDALSAAQEMAAQGFGFAAILASDSARTMATARIVAEACPSAPALTPDDTLYLAPPMAIWDAARLHLGEGGLLVVGHNPGMASLIAGWITSASDRSKLARALSSELPTAAWAAFDVENDPAESLRPRLLGGWAPKGF